jgi:hypothetical protein
MAVLRVKDPFAIQDSAGAVQSYPAGRLVDEKDPVVKGREKLFEAVEVTAARQAGATETADAPPAQKRARTAARKD